MKLLWSVLGTITGAMSISSLITQYSRLGLKGVIEDLVTFYQSISSAIFGWLPSILGVDVPQWLCDLWTLSFVLTAATFRMIHYDYSSRGILEYHHRPPIGFYIFQSISFIGIWNALLYCVPIIKHSGPIKRTDPRTGERVPAPCYRIAGYYILKSDAYWFGTLAAMIAVVLLFFVSSAYGPSA